MTKENDILLSIEVGVTCNALVIITFVDIYFPTFNFFCSSIGMRYIHGKVSFTLMNGRLFLGLFNVPNLLNNIKTGKMKLAFSYK